MNKRQPSLIFCLAMDFMGYVTYALPFFGEFADVFWAPVSGLIFFITFGGWKGAMGGLFGMVEELLPGTDFIPSFTIMWFVRNWQTRKTQVLPSPR
ncbi:MAG TPA: hypothetical protein VEV87_01685 [Chitinophagaceae bacterium]|nr:hypothetical protein [Chitinophagaceae bacterium]